MAAHYLILLAVILLSHEAAQSKESKYILTLEYIQQCPEPEYADLETPLEDIQIYKINRTVKTFSFSVTLKRPWDADVGFKMELDIWAYAGWTRLPYIPILPNVCSKLKSMFRDSTTDVLKSLGIEELQQCPIPPGHYTIRNYTCPAIFGMNFPFTGRFRARTVVMSIETKVPILCTLSIINIKENLLA